MIDSFVERDALVHELTDLFGRLVEIDARAAERPFDCIDGCTELLGDLVHDDVVQHLIDRFVQWNAVAHEIDDLVRHIVDGDAGFRESVIQLVDG